MITNKNKNDVEKIAEAIISFKSGNESAFEDIYNYSKNYVWYSLVFDGMDDEEAEDIMQETYLAVYNNIDTLKDEKAGLKWIKRIAANQKGTYIRKNIKEVATEDENLGKKEIDYLFPENILEHEETRKIIAQTIRELPKNQQKYIIGYYYGEYSIKAMSALYNVPEGTIKSDLSRAKKTLRDKIRNIEKKQRITLHSISFAPIILFGISDEIKSCEIPNEVNILKKSLKFSQNLGLSSHINSVENNILFINKGDRYMNIFGNVITKLGGMALKTKIAAGVVTVAVAGGAVGGGVTYHNYRVEQDVSAEDVNYKEVTSINKDIRRMLNNSIRDDKYKKAILSQLDEYVSAETEAHNNKDIKLSLTQDEMNKLRDLQKSVRKDLMADVDKADDERKRLFKDYWHAKYDNDNTYFDEAMTKTINSLDGKFGETKKNVISKDTSVKALYDITSELENKFKEYITAKDSTVETPTTEATTDVNNANSATKSAKNTKGTKSGKTARPGNANNNSNFDKEAWFNECDYEHLINVTWPNYKWGSKYCPKYNTNRNDPYNDIKIIYQDGTEEILHYGDVPSKHMADRSIIPNAYSQDQADTQIKNEADFQKEFQRRYGNNTEEDLREWNVPRTLNEAIQMGKAELIPTTALHLPLYYMHW